MINQATDLQDAKDLTRPEFCDRANVQASLPHSFRGFDAAVMTFSTTASMSESVEIGRASRLTWRGIMTTWRRNDSR